MKAPDKIYIQPNAHDKWWDGNKPNDNFQEYIRKDALIEWAKDNLLECEVSNDETDYGRIDVYKKLIEKLNSM